MILYTMCTLTVKSGPQSVPSGFGEVTQIYQSIFDDQCLTVHTTNDVKTEEEGLAKRIFYVVDYNHDVPTRSAIRLLTIQIGGILYNVFAENKPA